MGRRSGIALCAALIVAPFCAAGAAAPPPAADPEIVVNGKRIILEGGEWEFNRAIGFDAHKLIRPFDWKVCIPAGDQAVMLREVLGAMPAVSAGEKGGTLCGKMSLRIRGNRVIGSQGCTTTIVTEEAIASSRRTRRIEAVVTEDRLDIEADMSTIHAGEVTPPVRSNWRITARRTGLCRMPDRLASRSAVAPDVPSGAVGALPAAIPPRLYLEPLNVSLTITKDILASPLGGTGSDAMPARDDDIVVIGRRLRRAKLHFANEGRLLVWCHTDVSTGDARVDRIACAIVQACVREGVTELLPVRACYARKVALLDDDLRAARNRAPSS